MGTNSPCAACKFLRRRCAPECAFAPYFPPDQPCRFAGVHKVFGASNVAKLLARIPPGPQRHLAVDSLAYEADARLRDPVHGCVAAISLLQRHLTQLQSDIALAKSQLAQFNLATITATTSTSPFSSSSNSSTSSPPALAMAAPAQQRQQGEPLLQFSSNPDSYNKMAYGDDVVALHGLCMGAIPSSHHDYFQTPSALAHPHPSTCKEDHIH